MSFAGAITTQFCFTYALDGVTAMPRELYARLCDAFLVRTFLSIHVVYIKFFLHYTVISAIQ